MFDNTADNMTGMVVYLNPKGTKAIETPSAPKTKPKTEGDNDPSRFSV